MKVDYLSWRSANEHEESFRAVEAHTLNIRIVKHEIFLLLVRAKPKRVQFSQEHGKRKRGQRYLYIDHNGRGCIVQPSGELLPKHLGHGRHEGMK